MRPPPRRWPRRNRGSRPRRILAIHNPTAGWRRPRLLRQVVDRLREAGREVAVVPTRHPDHATALARAACDGRCDLVLAAGGDGTINEVLNGLRGSGLPLAICPLGTANVLAREIGLRPRAAEVAAAVLEGRLMQAVLGLASPGEGASGDRLFVQMLGVGFDAEVVARVSRPLKRRLGRWAYVLLSGGEAFRYGYPHFRVRLDGQEFDAASVIVANGRHYAGPYISAPEADLRADSLEVCLFHRRGPLHAARYGMALLLGRLTRLPDVSVHRAREVEILGPAGAAVQGDGDLFGATPVTLRLLPARQALVVPAAALVADRPDRG